MRTLTLLVAFVSALPSFGLERIKVSPDGGKHFISEESGKRFVTYGHNYGNAGRLIEDFWESEWGTIESDFREMKVMGANLTRVHLQFAKFMDSPEKPIEKALARLERLCDLADEVGIYLDLTGLGCYRKADTPAWYDAMDEKQRWGAQAKFWEAVARTCADKPAVFCYDLMNEPISPGGKREPGDWMSGKPFGGYDFVQFISLDPAGRKREDVAVEWIRTLTAAIRGQDKQALITVGNLPWLPDWKYLSGFVPGSIAPELDFVSVHVYPEKGKVDVAVECVRKFVTDKPLVIEETFPLTCSVDELKEFMRTTKPMVAGWVGHYDGMPKAALDELLGKKEITPAQSLWLAWIGLFEEMKSELVPTE